MLIILTLGPSFILLSISYEVLFYCALCIELMLWIILEQKLKLNSEKSSEPALTPNVPIPTLVNDISVPIGEEYGESTEDRNVDFGHLRVALFTVLFCFLAFFGTGNIASISSFEIASTYRFLTVFHPWVMAVLLLLKIFLLFAIVAIASTITTQYIIKAPIASLFLMVLALTNIMALNFFLMIKDSGSWRDIGMSIGHYVGMKLCLAFHMFLFALSSLVLRTGVLIL